MPGGRDRVDGAELAGRVNAAADLLAGGTPVAECVRVLAAEFGCSSRQARRYLDRAADGRVEIPDATVAFTVKMSRSLLARLRAYAVEHRLAISAVVAAALVEYLGRPRSPGRPER